MATLDIKGRRIDMSPRMVEVLDFAVHFSTMWHTMARDRPTRVAIERLHLEGLIEIDEDSSLFRVRPSAHEGVSAR